MTIGKHSAICRRVDVRCPYRIKVGGGTSINKRVLLDGRSGLRIGNNVDIAQDCHIWTLQHDYNSSTYATKGKEVIIEDYVWLGARSTVLPGVRIGYGAVIGAGSVVTKDIPPLSVAVGIPAKVVRKRDENSLKYQLGHRGWFM